MRSLRLGAMAAPQLDTLLKNKVRVVLFTSKISLYYHLHLVYAFCLVYCVGLRVALWPRHPGCNECRVRRLRCI